MKVKGEAFISHFAIYFEAIFGSIVWDALTNDYRLSMANFQYCPMKKCAIETTAEPDVSVPSLVATHDSAAEINQFFSNCRLSHNFDKFPYEI